MPEISFFIPAYNCAGTISESVDSIMETNFESGDELIIVNDCSTDNTAEVLLVLKQKYPGIQIITHKKNKGGAAARNTAVENAKHELLFCLDSDNVLEKNSIRPLITFLSDQKADIACFNELRFFSSSITEVEEIWPYQAGVFTITDLLTGKPSPGTSGNYLFNKTSWIKSNRYEEDLGALDTFAFGFKQLMAGCKMVVMPGSYYFHRRGHESYYIRDALKRQKSVSLRLIKLIINYIDFIHPDDVDYIFSKKGRYSWYDNLKTKPIRLISPKDSEKIWSEHTIEGTLFNRLVNLTGNYKKGIVRRLRGGKTNK